MTKPHLILGVGELLWDILPESSRGGSAPQDPGMLGGAPANFAVMAGRLGNHAVILSRIGRDPLGRLAVDKLDPMPVDTSALEVDPLHETGRVTVDFVNAEPHYTVHQPAAWDFMELIDEWVKLAERADAICFGSLAQRGVESRKTIQALAANAPSSCIRVFDVNLRAPFYSAEVIQESLELATVVKMNDGEAPQILELLGMSADAEPTRKSPDLLRNCADRLLEEFPALALVAITRGGNGSLLVSRSEGHNHPGLPVKVADPIGAGDAFTAAMVHSLLRGAGLAAINEAGNLCGGCVASQPGAMPPLPETVQDAIAAAMERES